MAAKLEFRGIYKAFPGVQALADVSFALQAGEVHALVGENGAGKSTLIKVLSGALQPDAGEMLLDGKPFAPRDPREALEAGIATIYQELNWLPGRNAAFNILMGREPARGGRLDFREMRRRSQEVLRLLHAEGIPLDVPAERLKAGQRQVLEIARALVRERSLLVMDEPTAALNREEQEALFGVVESLKRRGLTVLYVTHRLEEVFRLADRVTVLRDGRHVRTVPVAEITRDDLVRDMIGRPWTEAFPPRNPDLGLVLLSAEGLSDGAAFSGVSFTLREGEVLGITGLAGSGKEELGRALFGAHPLRSGCILLRGEPIAPSPRELVGRMAYIPDDRKTEGIIGALSVKRNISLAVLPRLAAWLGHIRRGGEETLARHWVERLDIKTPSLDQVCQRLSGGNQQKVALAKWLASEAQVLILAEPTQGIDVGVKFELYRLIADLSRQGTGIILISSELPEVLGLCHTILVLRDGQVVATLEAAKADSETVLRYALGQPQRLPAQEAGGEVSGGW